MVALQMVLFENKPKEVNDNRVHNKTVELQHPL